MNEFEANQSQCIHLRGEFNFHGNLNSAFHGPIKKGLRLLFWGYSAKIATSCSFVTDAKMNIGDFEIVELVVLSPQSIDKKLSLEEVYLIGFPEIAIGEFKIKNILGIWEGKVP
jgi:hypothetical protein